MHAEFSPRHKKDPGAVYKIKVTDGSGGWVVGLQTLVCDWLNEQMYWFFHDWIFFYLQSKVVIHTKIYNLKLSRISQA